MEKPFPYGEAFPLWNSLSLLEKPFHLEKRITCYDVNDLFMHSSFAGLLAVSPIGTHFWW